MNRSCLIPGRIIACNNTSIIIIDPHTSDMAYRADHDIPLDINTFDWSMAYALVKDIAREHQFSFQCDPNIEDAPQEGFYYQILDMPNFVGDQVP